MSTKTWAPNFSYVQPSVDDSVFLTSEQIFLGAGPPRLSNIGGSVTTAARLATGSDSLGSIAMGIGAIQSLSISQSLNIMRFFEIGSTRSYFIPGKQMGQLSLGRVLVHGPSLLRILYAYYQDLVPPTIVPAMYPSGAVIKNPHNVVLEPGINNFFITMMSDLFKQPVGMLMYVRDSTEQVYGACYFEQCYIPNHGIAFDSQGVAVQENVGIMYERVVPIATASIDLVTDTVGSLLT